MPQHGSKFFTTHTAAGILTHIDNSSVAALGYFPQDIVGKPILNFYHPEDMDLLKDVYETIMTKHSTDGASICGPPYRFLIQNGTYIALETVWSSFVNPWSRKLEYVSGNHRVIQGEEID